MLRGIRREVAMADACEENARLVDQHGDEL